MKLIGVHLSPYVRKAGVVLTAKGLEFEQEIVAPGMTPPEFDQISPLKKIPVLVDGDFSIADSSVICEYLEEKYPHPPLLPPGIEARAQARFLEEYADTRLVEVTSPIFLEGFANPRIFGSPTDQARLAEAREQLLPPVLDYLETRVAGEGFIFGDFTTADISVTSPILNAEYGGYQLDAGRWPALVAHRERVLAHDAVQRVRAIEHGIVKKLVQH